MRLIGKLSDKSEAERFSSYLLTQGMETMAEEVAGEWEIWVRDEDRVEAARKELEKFRQQPDALLYANAVHAAQLITRQKVKQEQDHRKRQTHMTSDRWNAPIHRVAPLTVVLMGASLVVSLLTNFGDDVNGFAMRTLALGSASFREADALREQGRIGEDPSWDNDLRLLSLRKLEFWRAITPIFIHFSGWHFFFNMMWLAVLGKQVEARYGSWWLLFLVVLIAVPSNLSGVIVSEQLDGIPIASTGSSWVIRLGGMSGVIYGLFGYVLIKMIFDPRSGLVISMTSVAFMLVWLLLCFTPAFQEALGMRVGNWGHGIGLVAGVALGYWPKLMSDLGLLRTGKP